LFFPVAEVKKKSRSGQAEGFETEKEMQDNREEHQAHEGSGMHVVQVK
jgi:hypothetical protein